MIRRQAWFLGKPVRALATGAILRKNTEIDEISQENAWNECVNAVFHDRQTAVFRIRNFQAGIQPTPRALSLRCRAERSMPTNSAVREILPENRLIWAIK
jgi:hypothetical protein